MSSVEGLTTTEVARRLHVAPEDVYRLIFAGELPGGPDADGIVRVSADDLAAYLERDRSRT